MDGRRGKKVKEEVETGERDGGASGWATDVAKEFVGAAHEARTRLRDATLKMANEAGLSPSSGVRANSRLTGSGHPDVTGGRADTNRGTVGSTIKTPKYSGRSDWEAFLAQFELLAHAEGWSLDTKALQLALCLTDDALSCLLLLNPNERRDYGALVGALQRRFGQCLQPELLRNELSNRGRKSGEPLRVLANDVESLTRRAYAHMPPGVQGELARDQFIRALGPTELRVQVQLQHPQTLQAALELAVERENVWGVAGGGCQDKTASAAQTTVGCPPAGERPAWVEEMTGLLRAVSLQTARRSQPGPRVCWGCGQPGHLVRDCPRARQAQGNGSGPA